MEAVLTVAFIFCLIVGWFLPKRVKHDIDFPFEVVVRERPPKKVIHYVDRPKSITTIAKPPPKPPPTTPAAAHKASVVKNRVEVHTIKTVTPQVNQEALREAKYGLMALGYRAGEAKRILEAVGACSTAEEYIRKAMARPKK